MHLTETQEPAKVAAAIPELEGAKPRTAQEQVLETLRRAILGGVLAPGTPLVLAELSERLGVSRTPIREALRELAAEGLVDFDSYRSAVVHRPTLAEARELYELRLVLEPIAIRKAVAKITDAQLDQVAALHEEMTEITDLARWVELNREFHGMLLDAADSPRLNGIVTGLRNVSSMQVSISIKPHRREQIERSNREHAGILAAFRDRDPELAVELTKAHLRTTLDLIEREPGAQPEPG